MDVDIDVVPIPDGHILGLIDSNKGRSCANYHCCGSTVKDCSVVFFSLCTVLDEILQELEDTIQVTMDCDLHAEGQRCRVGYLARRIAHDKVEAANYVNCSAVLLVIEMLTDSKKQSKGRMNMRGNGVALFTFLDEIVKIEDDVKEEEVIEIDDHLDNSNSTTV